MFSILFLCHVVLLFSACSQLFEYFIFVLLLEHIAHRDQKKFFAVTWCLSKWGIKSWFKSSRQCRPPKLWFSLFSSKKILSCQTAKLQCKTLDTPTKLNFLKEYVPREGRKEMTIDSRDFRSSKKRTTKVFFWITWGGWNSKKIYFD
jgi:hypothetical protein